MNKLKTELRYILVEFGYIALLHYMELLLEDESYELCQIVSDTITEYNKVHNCNLPFSLNDDVIRKYLDNNLNGEETLANMSEYLEEITRRLLAHYK